jgi:hypothetical protein
VSIGGAIVQEVEEFDGFLRDAYELFSFIHLNDNQVELKLGGSIGIFGKEQI